MHIAERQLLTLILILFLFTAACSGVDPTRVLPTNTAFAPQPTTTATVAIPEVPVLYVSAEIPEDWSLTIAGFPNLTSTKKREEANLVFEASSGKPDKAAIFSMTKVYAVAVPFFTVRDGVSADAMRSLWKGKGFEEQYASIVLADETIQVLTGLWGKPAINVKVLPREDLLDYCEKDPDTLAILPFEEIAPRWKVLKIDGLSPLDKPLEEDRYALTIKFNLISQIKNTALNESVVEFFSQALPATNRDESKITVLLMTGTTAITRVLAYKIRINNMEYPIGAVKDWFDKADLKHVSNESPFVMGCPVPHEFSTSLVFCTPFDMIEVLDLLGINVIEMTGNHINDYGPENLEFTLDTYKDKGWYVFAAGKNLEEARSPLLVKNNGNKIAFLGCNAVGPATVFAKVNRPGAAECDFDYLTKKIGELKKQGYVVVSTFQHEEETNLMYFEKISSDFQRVASAGADIVQGSQAHSPMGFEFIGDNLIHYGLGNFLFDQMVEWNRREFIDRHIIYDGKYINTELLTARLFDWSRPTPMTEEDRAQLLEEIFQASLVRKNENK